MPILDGSFVPTTNIWDVSQLYDVDINSPEFKELLVRLYQNINAISLSLNIRDAGYYTLTPFVNGQLYFPNPVSTNPSLTSQTYRPVVRQVVSFGALPNTGTKTVAHNIPITTAYTFTRIYGTATDPIGLTFIPLPFASPVLVNDISLTVDATNVIIQTGSNRSNYTTTFVVLEWIQQ